MIPRYWFIWLLMWSGCVNAATITATTGSPSDVQAAMDLAQAGDTVALPAGSNNWTAGVVWNLPANVTLRGAGTSETGGGDQTVIVDNYASGNRLMQFNVTTNGLFRLSGITVRSGTGSIKDSGTVDFNGPGIVRIDHCRFVATSANNYKMVRLGNGIFGVMDHCILDLTGLCAIYAYNGRSGADEGQGNLEWTLPTDFGGTNYFFVEDNIVNGTVSGGAYSTRVFDSFTASKMVVRFNTLYQSCIGETHATGHAPNDRGLRSQEAYGNVITSSLVEEPNYTAVHIGNGTGLAWGNSWDQCFKNIYLLNVTRKDNGTYGQSPTPIGWGYAGTNFTGTGSGWDGNTDVATGYPALDQPGRGQGDLLAGDFPNKTNTTTGTIAWPHQALEPIYIWNNTGSKVNGWGGNEYSTDERVLANRDYYPQASGIQTSPTSPFDGTTGTGWGTLANRPTTCTPGVAYWATDQGSWNTSTTNYYGVQQNGASGVLYKATAANTWTLYYTPYTYPHPLIDPGTGESEGSGSERFAVRMGNARMGGQVRAGAQ